jgi:hypothetical protein
MARSRTVEARNATLRRIPGSNDAWLDVTLRRRTDTTGASQPDTVTMLMNCATDSLIVHDSTGHPFTEPLVLPPGDVRSFGQGGMRIRAYGLRRVPPGQQSETLIRVARGGDLLLRTPVAAD